MVRLNRLKQGDLVRWVTPASPIAEDKICTATKLLESWGFRVDLGSHALDSNGYLAGSDIDRAADLMEAFLDPEVSAVFCTRGGYGCARLFPYLDLQKIVESRKFFAGYSDITTLHLALNLLGMPTVHAPMALTLHYDREPWVLESLRRVMFDEPGTPPEAPVGECLVSGIATGQTIGGCLCLLTDSIGTPFGLNTNGKILVIEDVDENPHRVDAMFTHLINCGVLENCAGIVVGEMTRTDERSDESIGAKPWRQIVSDALKPLGIPAIINYPFGHAKQMLTIPLGVHSKMDASSGTLTQKESIFKP